MSLLAVTSNDIFCKKGNLKTFTDSIATIESSIDIMAVTGFVINIEDENVPQALHELRKHWSPYVYLRPILGVYQREPSPDVQSQFDDLVKLEELSEYQVKSKFQKINNWISSLPVTNKQFSDTNLALKIVRLMASRAITLTPTATAKNLCGFSYPVVSALFGVDQHGLFKLFDFLLDKQLVSHSFYTKTHNCSNCESAFLNFTEDCPDCGSSHLDRVELIHHYKCGFVDKASKFKTETALVCPKCDETLRHIGVDYDKPSIIYDCQSCSLSFQEPKVTAHCFSCSRDSSVDDTIHRTINSLELTSVGENTAIFGMDSLFTSILRTQMDLYSLEEFNAFLKIEKSRIERYKKSTTSIAVIHLNGLDNVYEKLGKKTEQLFNELSMIFKSVFRESDLITALNESVFLVIMTETHVQNAELAISRLNDALNDLLKSNLEMVAPPPILKLIKDITLVENASGFAEELLGNH